MIVLSAIDATAAWTTRRLAEILLGYAARAAEIVADADTRLTWSRRLALQVAVSSGESVVQPRN